VVNRRDLTCLAALLESVRRGAAEKSGREIDRETWRRLLGERVAQRTEPERLQGKTLTVLVASSAWAQELSLLAPEIIERLQQAGFEVDTMRWRVGSPQSAPSRTPRKPKVGPVKELPTELERTLNGVTDPELRAAISEAAAHILGRQENRRAREAIAAQPSARDPQFAEPRTSRQGPAAPGKHAKWPRTRAKRPG